MQRADSDECVDSQQERLAAPVWADLIGADLCRVAAASQVSEVALKVAVGASACFLPASSAGSALSPGRASTDSGLDSLACLVRPDAQTADLVSDIPGLDSQAFPAYSVFQAFPFSLVGPVCPTQDGRGDYSDA